MSRSNTEASVTVTTIGRILSALKKTRADNPQDAETLLDQVIEQVKDKQTES